MKTNNLRYSYIGNIINKFAVSLPHLIVSIILICFLFAGIMGRLDLAIRGLVVAVPAAISAKILCSIYKTEITLENINISCGLNQKQLIYVFFIVYFSSLIIFFISSSRTWLYLIVISLLYFIILLQVFSKDFNSNFILLQIALCMLNLIYSVTLKYPLYFGGTDILPHLFMSQVTYVSGHTIPKALDINYANFPLFHILMSETSYIMDLDMKTSYFLISAPIFTLSCLFVYLLFLNINRDVKLSLLTTILYSTQSVVVYYGMYAITRVVAFVGFLMILYIVSKKRTNTVFASIGIFFALFTILVHQVSSPQILIVISLLYVSEKFIAYCTNLKEKYWNSTYIILFTVLFLAYWFYLAYSFTDMVLMTRFDSIANDPIQLKGSIIPGNQWAFLYTNINTSIFLFFAIIGIGVALWKSDKNYSAVFAFASLLFFPLYLPNPLQMLWQTMNLFRFDRFILLVSPFMAFSMALGISLLYSFLKIKQIKLSSIYLLIVILIMVFIVQSLIVNNPEVDSNDDRRYFTYEELTGFKYVLNYVPNDSNLYSDYLTKRYFCYTKFNESDDLSLPYYNAQTIKSIHTISHNGYFILKNRAFFERGLNLDAYSNFYLANSDLSKWNKLTSELNKKNKIYYNSDVSIYHI